MNEIPVLLLAFNRPQKLRALVESLRTAHPERVVVSLDGPREGREGDLPAINQCAEVLELIDWPCEIELIRHPANLGLRRAVEHAVTATVTKFGALIVVEDDVVVGPQFIDFMNHALKFFAEDERVMHINGYNVAPVGRLIDPSASWRLSRYPESFAWGTWDRAWKRYDTDLEWADRVTRRELQALVGTRLGAHRWKLNFNDARSGRISTWAYRWLASIWSYEGLIVSPNRNLVTYKGYDEGTHTRSKPSWIELPLGDVSFDCEYPNLDLKADEWIGRQIFGESLRGLTRGALASTYLEARRHYQKATASRNQ